MLRHFLAVTGLLIAFTSQSQLSLSATSYSTRCSGSATGLVEIESEGAVGSVTILTNVDLSALEAGDYVISAEDESGQNYGSGNSTIYNSLKKTSTVIEDNATDSNETQEKVPNPTKGQSLHKVDTDNTDQTKLRDFLKNLDGDE